MDGVPVHSDGTCRESERSLCQWLGGHELGADVRKASTPRSGSGGCVVPKSGPKQTLTAPVKSGNIMAVDRCLGLRPHCGRLLHELLFSTVRFRRLLRLLLPACGREDFLTGKR